MPRITQIKPQVADPQRFNVYLDGKFGFALPAEILIKAGLKSGLDLTDEKVKQLIAKNDFQKALDKTYRFVSLRPRSQKEVLDYLKRKKTDDQTTQKILTALSSHNLLDDLEFAKWWLEQRATFRPRGRQALKFELLQKGIAKEIINQVLQNQTPEDEYQSAFQTAQKYKTRHLTGPKSPQPPQSPELRQKLTAHLARRGFSWDIIKRVLQNL